MNEFFRKQPKLPQNCPSSKVDNEHFKIFCERLIYGIFLLKHFCLEELTFQNFSIAKSRF
jgi:hypothetical protein